MHYVHSQGITKQQTIGFGLIAIAVAMVLTMSLAFFSRVNAISTTEVVSGDTAAGENEPGWLFNRDASTSTPFEFNSDEASIGVGSLYVEPIGATPADKFIGEYFYLDEVSKVNSISYDFQTDDASDVNQFYMNLYVNDGSVPTKFYDCRYNVVPTVHSPDPTTGFTTFTYDLDTDATSVTQHASSTIDPCPLTPGDLPSGAILRAIALNVGDTNASDVGLDGYLDNVVLNTTDGIRTFDFEPAPADKDECKKGGWEAFGFSNQGQCVQYVNTGRDSR